MVHDSSRGNNFVVFVLIMKVTCAELQLTFKVEKGGLPDPHGPLAKTVPSSSIASEFKLLGSLY